MMKVVALMRTAIGKEDPVTSAAEDNGGNVSFGLMSPNLRFLVPTSVSL